MIIKNANKFDNILQVIKSIIEEKNVLVVVKDKENSKELFKLILVNSEIIYIKAVNIDFEFEGEYIFKRIDIKEKICCSCGDLWDTECRCYQPDKEYVETDFEYSTESIDYNTAIIKLDCECIILEKIVI